MKSTSAEQSEQDIERILVKLREDNPFASSASPLPWKNHNPDVPSLNRHAEEAIAQLIRKKRLDPSLPLAGLILGEAGVGKTHMLMRILRRMNERGQIAMFVAVRAFTDSKTVFWDLLQEIGVSLESRRQSEVLMSEMRQAYADCCEEFGGDARKPMDMRTLQRQIRQRQRHVIDDNDVLRFVLDYDKAADDNARSDLIMWLTGVAEENFAKEHDLPERDFNDKEISEREEAARKTLLSFGHVLEYARVPMVVCFDQLDMMTDEALINAWGACVNLLINDMPGALPLAFLRVDTWEEPFGKILDRSVQERCQHNKIMMENCDFEQAQELIRQRVKSSPVFQSATQEAEVVSQWLLNVLEKKLSVSDYPPRIVIDLANDAVLNPPSLDSKGMQEQDVTEPQESLDDWEKFCEAFNSELHKEIQKAAVSPDEWPPSERWLFDALNAWKISRPELELQSVNEKTEKYIRLAGKLTTANSKAVNCAFIFITSKTHSRAFGGANRGVKFIREHPRCRCWYITDGRTHKGPDRWRQVGKSMAEFKKLGGTLLVLDEAQRASWYGFLAFVNKVRNGDVTLYPKSGSPRSASEEELQRWLREKCTLDLLCGTLPASQSPVPPVVPTPANPDDKALLDDLSSFFSMSGIHMLAATEAIERFAKKGVKISCDELQALVTSHPDRFDWMGTKTAPLIRKVTGAVK